MRTRKYRAYHDKWGWASPGDIVVFGNGDVYIDYRGGNGDKIACYTEKTKELHVMDYIGLKDKNGLTELYEYDILDLKGIKIGNYYENKILLKNNANFLITEMGCETWRSTEQEAIKRGCRYAK